MTAQRRLAIHPAAPLLHLACQSTKQPDSGIITLHVVVSRLCDRTIACLSFLQGDRWERGSCSQCVNDRASRAAGGLRPWRSGKSHSGCDPKTGGESGVSPGAGCGRKPLCKIRRGWARDTVEPQNLREFKGGWEPVFLKWYNLVFSKFSIFRMDWA